MVSAVHLPQAPNCPYERIFVLPLTSISMSKGTGVVTRSAQLWGILSRSSQFFADIVCIAVRSY